LVLADVTWLHERPKIRRVNAAPSASIRWDSFFKRSIGGSINKGVFELIHENQEYRYPTNNTAGVLAGMLIGGLAGAVTMLLLAPQSGKDTRKQLQEQSIELRHRTTELVGDTTAQVQAKANTITVGLKERGQEIAIKQLENVSDVAQAGKKTIESS
jgi:gas vesicle protein